MRLVIGSKRYSSWSLRPWLLMRYFEVPFEEKLVQLHKPSTDSDILKFSPSGKVPVLIDGSTAIWESLAIAEYLNERFPERRMWPEEASARARARSISNEMHSGFQELRSHLPHDVKIQCGAYDRAAINDDIRRIEEIWTDCLMTWKGPFLFGSFSIADAMFAPVVNRFVSYQVPLKPIAQEYVTTIRSLPPLRDWIRTGQEEE